MTRFSFQDTALSGIKIIQRKPIIDERGFFARFFCANEFIEAGLSKPILQINQSFSVKKGTVRGMHFQKKPHAEIKIVSCIVGSIFDVAVDLRANSPTFLKWHGEILSSENNRSLLIPEGFAHGFQTLTENCEILYLNSAFYHQEAEGALNVNDSALAINWPLPITELSEKDRAHPLIDSQFKGIDL